MAAPLLPVTVAFFAGRLISYSLYIGAASAAERTLGSAFVSSLTSPYGVAIQILLLIAVVFLARIDWTRILQHRANPRSPPPATGNQGGEEPSATLAPGRPMRRSKQYRVPGAWP
jgi:hypothetical protein